MNKYFLYLSYNGQAYHGWQRQTKVASVQETIEAAFSKIFKIPIAIHGCGRTDTGVHATGYYAQIRLPEWDFDLVERANLVLPDDISIFKIIPVKPNANVQYDALSRTYQYLFHTQKNPILTPFSTWYSKINPDLKILEKGLDLLVGKKDFYAFCIRPEQYKDTHCWIKNASLHPGTYPDSYYLEFTANRFLQQMIRLTVGRLIELSIGKITLDDLSNALENRQTFTHRLPAPPQGLRLVEVTYDWEQLILK